ncbi:hypothetical protein ACFVYA_39120 [Amycolatopsis sp. NPDC058278]|uniref:hypothetical protein n=1 Tax=Amycolatopsis sp. NPDC058278 TaxID=3346417 RepID=UPI0036DCB5A6
MLVEIRIVLTVPGEPEPARTVLEDLGQRLGGLPDTRAVIREKSPGFRHPFGDARFHLDVVLSSEDEVMVAANV